MCKQDLKIQREGEAVKYSRGKDPGQRRGAEAEL